MAGDVDVQRLLLQVDASIDLAKRQMRELSSEIDNQTGNWDRSLEKGRKSFDKVEGSLKRVGQMRGGMQQLSFQINDVATQMSTGTKASVIFAQQSGQVVQALQLMTTGSSGFLKFMGGPWGIVLTSAATVAITLATKLFETRDATDAALKKMREQADQAAANERANKAWEQSIDGVREAQKKLKDTIDASLKSEAVQEQQNLEKARSRLEQQKGFLAQAEKERDAAEKARREFVPVAGASGTAGNVGASTARLAELDSRVEAARKKVDQLKADITASEATIRSAQTKVALDAADAAASATKAIGNQLDLIRGKLTLASQAGTIAADDFRQAMAAVNAYSEAQSKAAGEGVNFAKVGAALEVNNLTKSFGNGQTSLEAYVKRIHDLTKALNDAAKAAKDAKKNGTANAAETTQFILAADGPIKSGIGPRTAPQTGGGRTGSTNHAGLDIAVPIGTPVKAPAAGTVKIGNDPKGFGIFIRIDHGGGAQTTLGHLSKVDVKEGDFVEQGQVIASSGNTGNSTGPHLHQETRVGGKAVDPRKGPIRTDRGARSLAADRTSSREENRAGDRENAFNARMEQLESQLLQAQMELVQGIDAQAAFAEKMVDQEQKRFERAVNNDVREGRLDEADAKLLVAKSQEVADQRKKNIEARKALEHAEEENRTRAQELDLRIEGLRFEEEFAKSRAEARKIELEIIDLLYQQREADLRLAKAKAVAAGKAEEAARIQGQLDALPDQKARDQARAERNKETPLEQMARDASDLTDEIEDLKARGVMGLVDTLAAAGDGWDAMKETALSAIRQIIAELIRMQAMKAIFSILGTAAGGISGSAGNTAGAAPPGWLGSFDSMPVNLGSGLGVTGTVGFSGGGFVSGPGSSTSDSVDARLSNGEYVFNAEAVRRIGVPVLDAINNNRLPKGLIAMGGFGFAGFAHRKLGKAGMLGGIGLAHSLGGGLLGKSPLSGIGLAKKLLHLSEGGLVTHARIPSAASSASVPQAPANTNVDNSSIREGDTIINAPLTIHGSQSRRDARETQFQHERKLRRAIGRSAKRR